jgi:hypothetical protein
LKRVDPQVLYGIDKPVTLEEFIVSVEELKALERRYYEALNKKNLATLSEFFASDFVEHISLGSEIRGFEEHKKYINDMVEAFPDLYFTLHNSLSLKGIRWRSAGH